MATLLLGKNEAARHMKGDPRKDVVVRVRVDPRQREDLEWAARKNGLELSTWMRQLSLKEADRLKAAQVRRGR